MMHTPVSCFLDKTAWMSSQNSFISFCVGRPHFIKSQYTMQGTSWYRWRNCRGTFEDESTPSHLLNRSALLLQIAGLDMHVVAHPLCH